MTMHRHYLISISVLCLFLLAGLCNATEDGKRIETLILQPEPVEIVLLCPEGSKYEGELVPKWVSTDEATDFFCNDTSDETEIAE